MKVCCLLLFTGHLQLPRLELIFNVSKGSQTLHERRPDFKFPHIRAENESKCRQSPAPFTSSCRPVLQMTAQHVGKLHGVSHTLCSFAQIDESRSAEHIKPEESAECLTCFLAGCLILSSSSGVLCWITLSGFTRLAHDFILPGSNTVRSAVNKVFLIVVIVKHFFLIHAFCHNVSL